MSQVGILFDSCVFWCRVRLTMDCWVLTGEPVPPGDFRELKRLLYGLLVVVCASRVYHVVIDGVDVLSGDMHPLGMFYCCGPSPVFIATVTESARRCCRFTGLAARCVNAACESAAGVGVSF